MITKDNLERLRTRIYQEGFDLRDFAKPENMKAGLTLVTPVFPPNKSKHGVDTTAATGNVKGASCKLFVIVARAAEQPDGVLPVEFGDVVTIRQAHLDPMNEAQTLLYVKSEHIFHKWPQDFVEPVNENNTTLVLPSRN